MLNKTLVLTSFLSVFLAPNSFAFNDKSQECDINIKDRKFISGRIEMTKGAKCKFELKSGKKQKLVICNLDQIPAEFESHDLKIEKIIKGNSSVKIRIKDLEKGKIYKFEEEFGGYHCIFEGI